MKQNTGILTPQPVSGGLRKAQGRVTFKSMQLHGICHCGANYVQQVQEPIPFRAFPAMGVQRRTDRATGEKFLLKIEHYGSCNSCEPVDFE